MKLLIDTNVVLDVLLRREPFSEAAAEVLNLTQRDDVREYVSASAITDIYLYCKQAVERSCCCPEFAGTAFENRFCGSGF